MSDETETKHLVAKKKSKKLKKTFNLMDFVVVKQKNKKTQQFSKVKVSKQIQKRGKAKKKKLTTIKKRILRERFSNKSEYKCELETIVEDNLEDNENVIEQIQENIAQIDLNEPKDEPEARHPALQDPDKLLAINSDATRHSRKFREYCNHFITPEIRHLTEQVLKDLFKFQENKFEQNPGKSLKALRFFTDVINLCSSFSQS